MSSSRYGALRALPDSRACAAVFVSSQIHLAMAKAADHLQKEISYPYERREYGTCRDTAGQERYHSLAPMYYR